MRKLSELKAVELDKCICEMAYPAERLFRDAAVRTALDDMTKAIGDNATVETAMSCYMTILHPVLCGEAHRGDTYAILAALDGVTAEEIAERNGIEVMRYVFRTFVLEKDVPAIFRPRYEARGE